MPEWNSLNPAGDIQPRIEPRPEKPAPLTRDQAASAVHKILIPPNMVPHVVLDGTRLVVSFTPFTSTAVIPCDGEELLGREAGDCYMYGNPEDWSDVV